MENFLLDVLDIVVIGALLLLLLLLLFGVQSVYPQRLSNSKELFNIILIHLNCEEKVKEGARSYKSIAVPPPQVFGLVGPPKKRVNRDKLNR